MYEIILTVPELRALGSLIEKEATTPEYYPLTLNGLLAACNQKSNRWPATNYSEAEVLRAIEGLRSHRYAVEITGAGMRAVKFAQRFTEALNLGRRETAILCVLILRGAQTLGEIKDRSERLYVFPDLDAVEALLAKLIESGMATQLPRLTGQKEPRYAHLLGGPVEAGQVEDTRREPEGSTGINSGTSLFERVNTLEQEVAQLRNELSSLAEKLNQVL